MSQTSVQQVVTVELPVLGAFDLQRTIAFGFGQRASAREELLRLAFCLDGLSEQVGVVVRQPGRSSLSLEIHSDEGTPLEPVAAQVARLLSVDIDGRDYDLLAERDPVAGHVQRCAPGLRPPLFHSAYEAALWGVLSARQPAGQMSRVRERLAFEHGRVFDLAGLELAAVPLPHQLLAVDEIPGLFGAKLPRLHAIAQAALEGKLDTAALRALEPGEASKALQRLPGLGPFFSELIVVRALGHQDVLPTHEPRCRQAAAALVGGSGELSQPEFAALAEAWRPWRTWVVVGLRATA